MFKGKKPYMGWVCIQYLRFGCGLVFFNHSQMIMMGGIRMCCLELRFQNLQKEFSPGCCLKLRAV